MSEEITYDSFVKFISETFEGELIIGAFDLETIRDSSMVDKLPDAGYDARCKKPDAVAKSRQEYKLAQVNKMGLHPTTAHICAYGFAISNHDFSKTLSMSRTMMDHGDEKVGDEALLVLELLDLIELCGAVVTFNGLGFDIPMLMMRSLYMGLPHDVLRKLQTGRYPKKSRSLLHFDLMYKMGFDKNMECGKFDTQRRKLFGEAGGKDDIDGSQVQGVWDNGEYDRIKEYALKDAQATMGIMKRVTEAFGLSFFE